MASYPSNGYNEVMSGTNNYTGSNFYGSTCPKTPVVPVSNDDLTNKLYVDTATGGGIVGLLTDKGSLITGDGTQPVIFDQNPYQTALTTTTVYEWSALAIGQSRAFTTTAPLLIPLGAGITITYSGTDSIKGNVTSIIGTTLTITITNIASAAYVPTTVYTTTPPAGIPAGSLPPPSFFLDIDPTVSTPNPPIIPANTMITDGISFIQINTTPTNFTVNLISNPAGTTLGSSTPTPATPFPAPNNFQFVDGAFVSTATLFQLQIANLTQSVNFQYPIGGGFSPADYCGQLNGYTLAYNTGSIVIDDDICLIADATSATGLAWGVINTASIGAVTSVSGGVNIVMSGTIPAPIVNLRNPLTAELNMGSQSLRDSASAVGTSGQLLSAGTGGQTLWTNPPPTNPTITDTNTNATYYPTFVAGSGTQPLLADISTGAISLNPSNGDFNVVDTLKLTQTQVAVGKSAGTGQGANAVAIGAQAGATTQGTESVAIGRNAGQTSQGLSSLAIGRNAGQNTQKNEATAVGASAGTLFQGERAVAVGNNAGNDTQGNFAVAVGNGAGQTSQGANSVAIGVSAGTNSQSTNSVAVGNGAGQTTQGVSAVAIGQSAGSGNQSTNSVAIGTSAGQNTQGNSSVSVGLNAGQTNQGATAVAVGSNAGATTQGAGCVAIGSGAGNSGQLANAVAIGNGAGQTNQQSSATAVGYQAGFNTQGNSATAFGRQSGSTNQGASATAVGETSGQTSQGANSVAVGLNAGNSSQGINSVAVGNASGQTTQGAQAVAVGHNAGQTTQGTNAVAIGVNAGNSGQLASAVAIGINAGLTSQGGSSIAIGSGAGQVTQSANSVAVGITAGASTQGSGCVAIGLNAGNSNQGASSVAVGNGSGQNTQGLRSVAVGLNAGNNTQAVDSVAVGNGAGQTTQGNSSVSVGLNAGQTNQGIGSVAVGGTAGQTNQGASSVSVGLASGTTNQGIGAVAVGINAGNSGQLASAVAIGNASGQTTQGAQAVAVGHNAGQTTQGTVAVAVGHNAGQTTQGGGGVAIGSSAGNSNQGNSAVAIGGNAGETTQATGAVAVGIQAGRTTQGVGSIAVGFGAGLTSQGNGAVAIGISAGQTSQGAESIAIGNRAGLTSQPANSIVLNASGVALNPATASAFYVNPIRNLSTISTYNLQYNPTTNEVVSYVNNNNKVMEEFVDGTGSTSTYGTQLGFNKTGAGTATYFAGQYHAGIVAGARGRRGILQLNSGGTGGNSVQLLTDLIFSFTNITKVTFGLIPHANETLAVAPVAALNITQQFGIADATSATGVQSSDAIIWRLATGGALTAWQFVINNVVQYTLTITPIGMTAKWCRVEINLTYGGGATSTVSSTWYNLTDGTQETTGTYTITAGTGFPNPLTTPNACGIVMGCLTNNNTNKYMGVDYVEVLQPDLYPVGSGTTDTTGR